jgi:diaminopropionate ammonia-lyase
VVVVDGYYDDAIAMSAAAAAENTLVVSDTSWDGYEDIPGRVIEGYATIFNEVDTQIDEQPTHVFTPLGVGALGAATVAHFHDAVPRPEIVGVEPFEAACVQEALEVGEVITIESQFRTSMVGLNCGTASKIAYPALAAGLDWTVAISDRWSDEAMRIYAENGLVSGESGAACLGGLLAIADSGANETLGLDASSRVLLIVTESATDPENYERVVGRSPEEVAL